MTSPKRYKKTINGANEVVYIEDQKGKYREEDFAAEGLNIIDGKLEPMDNKFGKKQARKKYFLSGKSALFSPAGIVIVVLLIWFMSSIDYDYSEPLNLLQDWKELSNLNKFISAHILPSAQ